MAMAMAFAFFAATSIADAATREPLSVLRAELAGKATPPPLPRRRATALAARLWRSSRPLTGAPESVTSTYYGEPVLEEVTRALGRLDHGSELGLLSVYVATPQEIAETCGVTVIACYLPSDDEMVVSGENRSVEGVPRALAIAHEYGHHIANMERGGPISPMQAGTIRWATYERVCQLSRARRLFPGNQASHYWEDPEEAFAESYARLADPHQRVSWQYTDLLRPTAASLAKIQADIEQPWSGPVSEAWRGSVGAGPGPGAEETRRKIPTPLDGTVEVSVASSPGTALAVILRTAEGHRVVAHGLTDPEGNARLAYANCGHGALQLTVRGSGGATSDFSSSILRP
jgi:hypothetical protein